MNDKRKKAHTQRIARGEAALLAYLRNNLPHVHPTPFHHLGKEELEELLTDVMVDLLHYAHDRDARVDLELVWQHFEEEQAELEEP